MTARILKVVDFLQLKTSYFTFILKLRTYHQTLSCFIFKVACRADKHLEAREGKQGTFSFLKYLLPIQG